MTKAGIDERGRAKEYIGLLHQEYDLFPHRTVLDTLLMQLDWSSQKNLLCEKPRNSQMSGFTDEKA